MAKYKDTIMTRYDEIKHDNELLSKTLHDLLQKLLSDADISVNAISSRVKESSSLQEKIEKKGEKYTCLEDITDIVGSRIITYYSDEVDKIAKIIEKEFIVDDNNTIDKRKSMDPDRFGYMSLHYVCQFSTNRTSLPEYSRFKDRKFEIQIRSVLQHTWAEIEHDAGYKSQIGIPRDIKRNFSLLSGLLELADDEFIRIREKLSDYKKTVSESLQKDCDEEILIDNISLKEYLKMNKDISELNSRIFEINNFKEKPVSSLEDIIQNLTYLNVKTLKELDVMLKHNNVLAYEIAKKFLTDDDFDKNLEELSISIGIFYLCYAELLIKEFSDDEIIDYLLTNQIGLEVDALNTAQDLRTIYKNFKQESFLAFRY